MQQTVQSTQLLFEALLLLLPRRNLLRCVLNEGLVLLLVAEIRMEDSEISDIEEKLQVSYLSRVAFVVCFKAFTAEL